MKSTYPTVRYGVFPMVKGKTGGNLALHRVVLDGEGREEQAGRVDASELADRPGRAEALGVEGPRASVALRRQGDRRARRVPRRGAVAHGWGFPNFSTTYTVMNNDLKAVINGSKSVSADALRRPERAQGASDDANRLPPARLLPRGRQASPRCLRVARDRQSALRAAARGRCFGAACARASGATASSLVPMAVFGIFFIYPIGYAIYISFFNWGILGKIAGARPGLCNYRTSSTTRSSTGRSRTPWSTRSSSCRSRWRSGSSMALIVNAGDPRPGVLPRRRSTSRRSPRRRDHDDRDLHPQRGRAAEPHHRLQPVVVRRPRAPHSGRSSASTRGRRRGR